MEIVSKAENYIRDLYANHPHEPLLFHNYNYTTRVVKCANKIVNNENLEDVDIQMVLLSVWFLNVGYLFDFVNHINQSIRVVKNFIEEYDYPVDKAEIIIKAIERVLKNNKPQNIIEKVLSDANNSLLSSEELLLWVKHNRQERNYFVKPKVNKRSFWQTTICLLNEHEYYTQSAKNLFQKGMSENIEKFNLLLTDELSSNLPKNNIPIVKNLKAGAFTLMGFGFGR